MLLAINAFLLFVIGVKIEQRTRALFDLDNDDMNYNDWNFERQENYSWLNFTKTKTMHHQESDLERMLRRLSIS